MSLVGELPRNENSGRAPGALPAATTVGCRCLVARALFWEMTWPIPPERSLILVLSLSCLFSLLMCTAKMGLSSSLLFCPPLWIMEAS